MEQPEKQRTIKKKKKESPIKLKYIIHTNNVDGLSDYEDETPIAQLSGHGRYHGFDGNGGLKYDPVDVNSISFNAAKSLQEIRTQRWNPSDVLTVRMVTEPGCQDLTRKIMMVPSIGCPAELTNYDMIQQLLWVRSARYRPTFLFVHECEINSYEEAIGGVLEDLGVGLVAWMCGARVGFGLSRLAAQQFAMHYNPLRLRVVLCDVNVTAGAFLPKGRKPVINHSLEDGYDTDKQSDSDVEGKSGFELKKGRKRRLLYAAGSGAGIPSLEYGDSDTSYSVKRRAEKATFSNTRPIEQVAIVRPELQYDPRFISSSEDSDIQAAFLDKINVTDVKEFKRNAYINKVEFKNYITYEYVDMRDAYLQSLRHEDDYFIQYSYKGKNRILKVGELADVIATQHGKKQLDIRSLIIEKILLKHKW